MPSPSRLLLATCIAGAAAVAVAAAACANPDTYSPNCNPNVDENGVHPDPNGCDQLPACNQPKVSDCCVDAKGAALKGNDLAACLHGYGDPSCAYLDTQY